MVTCPECDKKDHIGNFTLHINAYLILESADDHLSHRPEAVSLQDHALIAHVGPDGCGAEFEDESLRREIQATLAAWPVAEVEIW